MKGMMAAMNADNTEHTKPVMFRKLVGIVLPVVLLVLATGALLRMLKEVPDHIQPLGENVVFYQSLEDAEKELNMDIMVPSYFPDSLAWPPAGIRLEKEPRSEIMLLFKYRQIDRFALTIKQSLEEWGEELEIILPARPWSRKEIMVNGSPVEMASFMYEEGFWRHRVRWRAHERYFEAETDLPAGEFIRIVNSIFK